MKILKDFVGRKGFLSASTIPQGRVKHLCRHIILDKFLCDHFTRISLLIFLPFSRVSNHRVIRRFFPTSSYPICNHHLHPSSELYSSATPSVLSPPTFWVLDLRYARALRDRRILFILTISLVVKS